MGRRTQVTPVITWLRAAASTGFGSPVRSHEFPDAAAPLRYCALVKLAFIISQGHVATPTGVVTTVTEACGPA